MAPPERLRLKEETFDRDPGWQEVRSRVVLSRRRKRQDFGYQGGQDGRRYGRIGGVVWRSVTPASYALPLAPLNLEQPFSASGTIALTGATTTVGWQNGSTLFVGFFNRREQGWRPRSFAGFRLEGYNEPDGATVELSYGTREWTAGGTFLNRGGGSQERLVRELDAVSLLRVAPDGRKHAWSLRYDPAEGAGVLSMEFDGAVTRHALRPEHRRQGADLDRFGLFNGQMPGNNLTAYLDDLVVNGRRVDLSRDPRWEGRGNRAALSDATHYGANDFGYRRTSLARGRRGELAGRAWRVQEPEYMGYCGDDVGRLTLDDPLFASGRLAISRFCVDAGLHVGWFSSAGQGWPPRNFVGAYLDSQSDLGRFITPMFGTSRAARVRDDRGARLVSAAHAPPELLFRPDGTGHTWSLRYEPEANQGRGALTLTLGTRAATLPLPPGARAEGAEMDRFGVFNMQDNNGKDCLFALDDLRYTTARPPTGHASPRGRLRDIPGIPYDLLPSAPLHATSRS